MLYLAEDSLSFQDRIVSHQPTSSDLNFSEHDLLLLDLKHISLLICHSLIILVHHGRHLSVLSQFNAGI